MPKLKKQSTAERTKKQRQIITKQRNKEKCDKISLLKTKSNKVILGDFSQFSNEFPYPHHQCTAMATVAFVTASFKSVFSWNSNDLNNIIRTGQTYYENSRN